MSTSFDITYLKILSKISEINILGNFFYEVEKHIYKLDIHYDL